MMCWTQAPGTVLLARLSLLPLASLSLPLELPASLRADPLEPSASLSLPLQSPLPN